MIKFFRNTTFCICAFICIHSPSIGQVIVNQTQINIEQKQTNVIINGNQSGSTPTNNNTNSDPLEGAMKKAEWETHRNNLGKNPGYTLTEEDKIMVLDNVMKKQRIQQYSSLPRYYAISKCNLRTGGGTNYPIITSVDSKDYVYVIDTEDQYSISGPSKWWKVYYFGKDKVGYIYKSSLKSDPQD